MAIYKLHSSGEITPVRVHEKIGKLITEGYPKKQAMAIAYNEARQDWHTKHSDKKMPPWLDNLYGKNPISEKTAHKLRKAAPKTFMKMTDEEIKRAVKVKKKNPAKRFVKNRKLLQDLNKAIGMRNFYEEKNFPRMVDKWNGKIKEITKKLDYGKNPVRALKKKSKKDFTLQTFIGGKTYYWTGVKFDTLFQKAIKFHSIPLAKLAAKSAYKKYPKINIYLSGDGVTA
jgi:uncharacterized protein YdaT